jgi:ssDNA-binding Zn-finger/Zn-ribbon topoisomerase 1
MYNFITINVNCPSCGKSLMDAKKLVDNEPSINLIISTKKDKGLIWLSSIYGSYNYSSEVETPGGELANFHCPHCRTELTSKTLCNICQAPMVDFNLDMGGRVSICSRSGCKNHAVAFEDLSLALKTLYQEYGFRGRDYPKNLDLRTTPTPTVAKHDENAEILETGTFLQAYCPKCRKSLIENEMLRLKISNGEEGDLLLSPYLNVFTSKSTIFLPEEKTVKDLKCPHCNDSLVTLEKECGKCGSPAARILISARTKFIDFYICTKKGCRWHGLNEEDLYEIKLEDSDEW